RQAQWFYACNRHRSLYAGAPSDPPDLNETWMPPPHGQPIGVSPVEGSPFSLTIPNQEHEIMTRMNRWACIAVFAFAAAGITAAAAQSIKLGELNSYKTFPAFLEPYKKGMELALEEVNAAGGVLGRPLEIVSRDDNGNPGDAVRVAEELLSREKAVLLMGTFASNVGLAVADMAKQRKVLFLAPE